uniref:Exocyst complex component 8 n=1 Tax=Setaria digitata TaxID=48799 RepID=A0A915PWW9_9BILA
MKSSSAVESTLTDDQFGDEDFDAVSYVRDQLKEMKNGDETRQLQIFRARLNAVNTQSSESMKKNRVLTLDLEREIYELSSLLSDQRMLIEALMQMTGEDRSSIGTSSLHTSSFTVNPMNILMQKMDGIAGLLNNLPNSDRVIMHGEVVQLDSDSMRPQHNIMLILLSDRLLIGQPSSGKYRFKLESSHPLNNIAAVNIKDRESGETATSMFKLLIFPGQRIFRAESARIKKEWLECIENAKRELLHEGSLVRQATIRGKRRQDLAKAEIVTQLVSVTESITAKSPDESAWLSELPAELDDCIAHRDMEHAVRRPGALHGGPRAVRKAINLLTVLGRASQAVDLYLRKRSTVLRTTTRELTMSEEPLSYVRQLSQQFLDVISDVVKEFSMQPEHFSLILHWCSGELSVMLSLIRRHVIAVAPTMAVLAHTWRILMTHCDSLVAVGVDLSFEVHRLLAPSLKIAVETNFANIIESVRLRVAEERWKPYNMENESNVNRFVEEMSDMGLAVDWALSTTQHSSINITQNACHFSRVAYVLARDLAMIRSSHLRYLTDSFMVKLWTEYLNHLKNAPQSSLQQCTSIFIVSQLLPLCDTVYDESASGILSGLLETKFEGLLRYRENLHRTSSEEDVAHVNNFGRLYMLDPGLYGKGIMYSIVEGGRNLIDRVRRVINGNSAGRCSSFVSTVNLTNECGIPSRASSIGYTELMEGSVPCPSCKGSGRIPKELEETLVALIPVNDDRLKPKRTWLYVLCVVLGCLLLAGVVIFLLVPRAIYLSSLRPPVEIITVFDHTKSYISFHFMNEFNISNANYYSVKVLNSSATVLSKFLPWSTDVIGIGGNTTAVLIGPRTSREYTLQFNNTVTLKDGVAEYCQAPFSRLTSLYVNMQFDISVTLEYLSHHEQATLSVVQQVCCVPSGNCTAS